MIKIYLLHEASHRSRQPRLRLGVKTELAELWDRQLVGAQGSAQLSYQESVIVQAMMLRPGILYSQFIPLIWSQSDWEPEQAVNVIKQVVSRLNVGKLRVCGLTVNRSLRHREGKWLEAGSWVKPWSRGRVDGPGSSHV